MSKQSLVVIVPTYNERNSVSEFFTRLAESLLEIDKSGDFRTAILNVDDNSPDGTASIISSFNLPNFHQIIRSEKAGLGPAYIEGFHWALDQGFDLIVQMDADNSHHPEQLTDLLAKADSKSIVLGTRWMPGGRIENWPWQRRFLSRFGTFCAAWAIGSTLRDLTTGYRIIGREVLVGLDLGSINSKGYGFQIELVQAALACETQIIEVPITFTERTTGRSKMSSGIVLEAAKSCLGWGFSRITRTGVYRR